MIAIGADCGHGAFMLGKKTFTFGLNSSRASLALGQYGRGRRLLLSRCAFTFGAVGRNLSVEVFLQFERMLGMCFGRKLHCLRVLIDHVIEHRIVLCLQCANHRLAFARVRHSSLV